MVVWQEEAPANQVPVAHDIHEHVFVLADNVT